VLQPLAQQLWRDSTDFISISAEPPRKRRCAHSLTNPASFLKCSDWCVCGHSPTSMDRCVIIIINKCVECTAFCLFGRALAPIPFTLCPISLHQPRATSPVRLLLASVESNVLLSNIIISPSIARNLRNGLHKMLALIVFVSYQSFRLRQGFDYRHF
jgi:hypothetical protein